MSVKDRETLQNLVILVGIFFGIYLFCLNYEYSLASMIGPGIISLFAILGVLLVCKRKIQKVNKITLRLMNVLWMVFSLVIPLQIVSQTIFEISLALDMVIGLLLLAGLLGVVLLAISLFMTSDEELCSELSDFQVLISVIAPPVLLFVVFFIMTPIFNKLNLSYAEITILSLTVCSAASFGLVILGVVQLIRLQGIYKLCSISSIITGLFGMLIISGILAG